MESNIVNEPIMASTFILSLMLNLIMLIILCRMGISARNQNRQSPMLLVSQALLSTEEPRATNIPETSIEGQEIV